MRRVARMGLMVLVAAAVVGAVLAFQYRQEIAYRYFVPEFGYDEMGIIPRPVYLFPKWWSAHPDFEDLSDSVPAGVDMVDTLDDTPADVFFIHPTTYLGDDWNAHGDDSAAGAIVDGLVLTAQAGAFNGCCRIFVPRYRQAHLATFVKSSANGRKALELAYIDVHRAFEEYLLEWNNDRPFIIAGHSQGALMALRLISERIDETPMLRKLFVGAYIMGAGIPLDRFETDWETIGPCETATDFGCVASWETYVEGTDPTENPGITEEFYLRHWVTLANEPRNCINPLTWSREPGHADAALNLGALPIEADLKPGWSLIFGGTPEMDASDFADIPAPIPGYTGAECRDGFLFVDAPRDDAFSTLMLGDGNMHAYDISLFYMNIRQNAVDRVQAFLEGPEAP
jgi:pimeloyl-ACP methyl ester carboxylesterase